MGYQDWYEYILVRQSSALSQILNDRNELHSLCLKYADMMPHTQVHAPEQPLATIDFQMIESELQSKSFDSGIVQLLVASGLLQ
jgi:hypothetical protein